MKVSIVVPTYNSARTLRLLLDAVTAETPATCSFEVLVVDDGSTDETERLVGRYPAVRYIRQDNAGPAAARNRGAREASGDYVIFIDSDIVPDAGTIDRLVRDVERDREVAGVSGIYAEAALFNDGYVADYRNLQTYYWKASSGGRADDNFPVSLCILHRATFLEAGGLVEAFRGADVEDFEFGRRMTARGATLLVSPRVQGHHHPEETLRKLLRVLFRRSRQYAASVTTSVRSPSHYATAARSLTLAGSLLAAGAVCLTPWSAVTLPVAAAMYAGLVVYPERAYYRFLRARRPVPVFVAYAGFQLLANIAMALGLIVGTMQAVPLRVAGRRSPRR